MTVKYIIKKLEQLSNPEKIKFKEDKFGIISNNSLGIYPTQDTPDSGERNWQKDSRTWCSTTFDWVF